MNKDNQTSVLLQFTSNKSWVGILDDFWPRFKPLREIIKFENEYTYFNLRIIEKHFQNGVSNFDQCVQDVLKKKNCTFICTLFSFANFPQRGQIWLDLLVEVWECFFGFSISASMYNCIEKLIPHWIFTKFFLSIFFKRIFPFCVKMGKKLQSTSKFVW